MQFCLSLLCGGLLVVVAALLCKWLLHSCSSLCHPCCVVACWWLCICCGLLCCVCYCVFWLLMSWAVLSIILQRLSRHQMSADPLSICSILFQSVVLGACCPVWCMCAWLSGLAACMH
ncbi:hypothetical protein COO60DRAFT_1498418 [Scenedesmus sp. NREL 46B-D3]|nr:hypothetical protein COO60DRAFT_1498418 [Scenedesmus sp. NREL 46B-D3]